MCQCVIKVLTLSIACERSFNVGLCIENNGKNAVLAFQLLAQLAYYLIVVT